MKKEIYFYGRTINSADYCKLIDKRIRKFIRTNNLFSTSDNICIIDDSSAAFFVTKHILERLSLKFPINISTQKKITKKALEKFDKIVFPITADHVIDEFLEDIFFYDIEDFHKERPLSILNTITEKECFLFAKEMKLIPKNMKMKKHLLDSFEDNFPETKFAALKSVDVIEDIIS
ncbi:MAG: hypothetical protein ACLFPQ_00355 [Candidatus Woesearchaeota archaeon]